MAKQYLDQLSRMVDRATSGEIGCVDDVLTQPPS